MADDAEKTIPNQEKKSYINPFLQIVGDSNEMLLDDTPYLPVVNMASTDNSHGINSLLLQVRRTIPLFQNLFYLLKSRYPLLTDSVKGFLT